MKLSFLGAVALAVVLLAAQAESRPQAVQQDDGGAGLSLQETRAVYYFKQIVAYSILSKSRASAGLGEIWSDCSKPGDMMKIVAVDVKPDPPVKGQTLSVMANFTIKEDVTGGNVMLNISIDGVNVVNEQMDLCATLPQVNLMCPLKMGEHTLSISVPLPSDVPSGHVTGSQYVDDQNSKELACVSLDLKL